MKRFSTTILIALSIQAVAQTDLNYTNFWYFNFYCGMDFSSGSPVSLTNSALYTGEGTTAVSDSDGNLLFYTNGVDVYNKNNQLMVNGSGLYGGWSTSQSCVAIPLPGSDSLWYLFTQAEAGGNNGAQYSIIDMSLQGGLGEVITKNVLLQHSTEEKLTAVKQANGVDYWIAYHKNGNNKFFVYPLTSAGVGAAVTSTTGTASGIATGCMKFSPNGKKLAMAKYVEHSFEIFDFNDTTGVLTYNFTINIGLSSFDSYGVEWTCDSKLLYIANVDVTPGEIYQFNMSLPTVSDILASKYLVNSNSDILGTLQMGRDGKIYINRYNVTYLGVINDPDSIGAACNYSVNGFSTAPNLNYLGLPNYPTSWFRCDAPVSQAPSAAFASNDSAFCSETCVDFFDQSTNFPTSWQWSFPGGNPSSSAQQNPTNICYSTSGTYDVTLITSNSFGSDTITLSNFITVNAAPTANITQSNDTLYSSAGNSYQWYTGGNPINGATDYFYVPSTEDYYTVVVTDANGCTAADTIFFSLSPQTNFSASDTTICQKFCMDFFDQSGNNPTTWQWSFPGGVPSSSNQQNPTQICYNNPGVYDVTLITTNSFGSDTLVLSGYITVYSTPAFPTITVTGDILTSSYASSYQWQFNSVDIPGATNQSYTATQTGYYTVIITDENGCVSSTTVFVEVTGIESVGDDFGVSVYPNPSNGNFIIEFSGTKSSEQISLDLVNALGQTLFSFTEIQQQAPLKKEIQLSNLPAGIYFIRIQSQDISLNKKILISK